MADRWAILLAVTAAVGATHPRPVPALAAVGAVAAALLLRRPALLCLAVGALASGLATMALDGLRPPAEGDVVGPAVLVTDPTPSFGGIRAEARLGDRRVELRARGVAADGLRDRLAGEVVHLRGQLRPLAGGSSWASSRHLSGRVQVHLVEGWEDGGVVPRTANGLRRTLDRGAEPLDPVARSLYLGLVIGDDRQQPASLSDDFQGAGLTHLLAVSGQNVAFVLVLGGPVLRRLRLWPRALLALGLIGLFGVMTRFEPSVLRASLMAALALLARTAGSPFPRVRVLALAVAALLLVDPLLVRSVGFQLSVAASAAIVVLAAPLERALPGPSWLRAPLSVTVAAQLGVAPVLVNTFGPLPVASLPANLLAVPVAGLVMVWGLTAGMVAGVAGTTAAQVVHLPTRLLLGWLAEVASRTAGLPLGQLDVAHLVALTAGLGVAVAARHLTVARPAVAAWEARLRRGGLGLAGAALATAVLTAQVPPGLRATLRPGLVRWQAQGTEVVVLGGAGGRTTLGPAAVLAALREADVDGIDLLVLADSSIGLDLAAAVDDRHPLGAVLVVGADASDAQAAVGAPVVRAPSTPRVVVVGALELRLTPVTDRLVVEARPRP